MKRLRVSVRVLRAGAVMLSALLCLVSLGMWVRSYMREEMIGYSTPESDKDLWTNRYITSTNGVFSAVEVRFDQQLFGTLQGQAPADFEYTAIETTPLPPGQPWHTRLGFNLQNRSSPVSRELVRAVSAPHWFLSLLFGIAPAVCFLRRWRSIPAGHCQACGYDLRETPQRCPECGSATGSTLS